MSLFLKHEAQYIYKKSPDRLDNIANVFGQRSIVTFESEKELDRRHGADGRVYVHKATFLHVDVLMPENVLTNENMKFYVEKEHVQISNPAV